MKLLGKWTVPGASAGYITAGVVSVLSLAALYGVVMAFVLRTIPTAAEEAAGYDPVQRKLKESMVGLIVGAVVPLFVVANIAAGFLKKPLQGVVFLLLYTGVSALAVLSTVLAYTQDPRLKEDAALKRSVEIGMYSTVVATVVLGAAGGLFLLKNRARLKASATASIAQLKQGDLKGAAGHIVTQLPKPIVPTAA